MSREFHDATTFGAFDTVRQMLASDPALVRSTVPCLMKKLLILNL